VDERILPVGFGLLPEECHVPSLQEGRQTGVIAFGTRGRAEGLQGSGVSLGHELVREEAGCFVLLQDVWERHGGGRGEVFRKTVLNHKGRAGGGGVFKKTVGTAKGRAGKFRGLYGTSGTVRLCSSRLRRAFLS